MHYFIQHRAVLDPLGVGTENSLPESWAVDIGNSSFGVGREEEVGSARPKVANDGVVALFAEGGGGGYGVAGEMVGVDDGQGKSGGGEDG